MMGERVGVDADFRAVFFDLGGVVFDSPFPVIANFETTSRLPPGTITTAIRSGGRNGAWGRLERGEISIADFGSEFHQSTGVDGRSLLSAIEAVMIPRNVMIEAIGSLRSLGYGVVAITNNWAPMPKQPFGGLFDHVVESVVEGYNKPDRELYDIALKRSGMDAGSVVMLDDIGVNLKAAQAIGMATIKVVDPHQALQALSNVLGVGFDGSEFSARQFPLQP